MAGAARTTPAQRATARVAPANNGSRREPIIQRALAGVETAATFASPYGAGKAPKRPTGEFAARGASSLSSPLVGRPAHIEGAVVADRRGDAGRRAVAAGHRGVRYRLDPAAARRLAVVDGDRAAALGAGESDRRIAHGGGGAGGVEARVAREAGLGLDAAGIDLGVVQLRRRALVAGEHGVADAEGGGLAAAELEVGGDRLGVGELGVVGLV